MREYVIRCDWISEKGNCCNKITNTTVVKIKVAGSPTEKIFELCDHHAELFERRFRLREEKPRGRKPALALDFLDQELAELS